MRRRNVLIEQTTREDGGWATGWNRQSLESETDWCAADGGHDTGTRGPAREDCSSRDWQRASDSSLAADPYRRGLNVAP